MKKIHWLTIGILGFAGITRAATINVTTDAPTGAGSLTAAINALNNGDTIAFHIPPEAGEVHYIQVPLDGFPIITNNNVTINGYSQGGAAANTATLHAANNAALKVVLTATNGHGLSMHTACVNSFGGVDIPRLGYDDTEIAILGFFHATNATVQGLVFQANPFATNTLAGPEADPSDGPFLKAVCFAANSPQNGSGMCQNFRVSGCWFGVDPATKQVAHCTESIYGLGTVVASPAICVASYRTRNPSGDDSVNFNHPGTLGVAVGSANPRAEFNVWVAGYGFDSEGLDYRFSGNFFGVLPDGVTGADMGVLSALQQSDGFIEIGRNDSNITVGTDGDGVNDDQEGNIFGPMTVGGTCMNFYGQSPGTNVVIAGNYFGLDINGKPFGPEPNANPLVDSLGTQATIRFGSDFNGVGDAFEGNTVTNSRLIAYDAPASPGTASWVSMRRNSLLNTTSSSGGRPPLGDGSAAGEGQEIYAGFIDIVSAIDVIPVVGAATTTTTLAGTCGKPATNSSFTNLVVDLYEADTTAGAAPQGKRWIASFMDNSPADANPAVGAFSFSAAGLGLASGNKVTITVTYSKDTQPTISSIARSGNQTTLNVTGGASIYGIQQSTTLNGPYTFIAAAVGGAVSFTDNSETAFYRATGPSATGQTSPFSDVYTIP